MSTAIETLAALGTRAQGCANGSKDACKSAQEYRDERVRRATKTQPGTGSGNKPSADTGM